MSPQGARVAVSGIFLLDGAVLGGWITHIPDIKIQHHLTDGQLGNLLLMTSFGALSTMPFSGPLIHRFGSRMMCIVTSILLLLILPWLVWQPSIPLLAVNMWLMGATNGMLDVAMNAHSMAVQRRFDRPILSAIHGWFSLGGFIAALGAWAAGKAHLDARTHLIVASVVLALTLPFLFSGLLTGNVDQEEEGKKFVVPHGRLLLIGALVLVAFVAEGSLWDWGPVYFRGELGTNALLGSIAFGVSAGTMALARFMGDGLVHEIGHKRALVLSGLCTGGGLLISVAVPHPAIALLGFGIAGFGLANSVPLLFNAAATIPGISPGAGLAAVTAMGYSAFLGGPPLIGHVADLTSMRLSLGLIGVIALLLCLLGPKSLGEKS